jgi:hypothetical protein
VESEGKKKNFLHASKEGIGNTNLEQADSVSAF